MLQAISPLLSVYKRPVLQTRKTQALFGKGLKIIICSKKPKRRDFFHVGKGVTVILVNIIFFFKFDINQRQISSFECFNLSGVSFFHYGEVKTLATFWKQTEN